VRCDGCGDEVSTGDLFCPEANGHSAKYCGDCYDSYLSFLAACEGEEGRLNALLDVFISQTRDRVPLKFVPQDLKPIARRKDAGNVLRLG
jgi:hypothetical protein